MAILRRVIGGLKALFRSSRLEQELDEELRGYLESSMEAKVGAGMSRHDARRACAHGCGSA